MRIHTLLVSSLLAMAGGGAIAAVASAPSPAAAAAVPASPLPLSALLSPLFQFPLPSSSRPFRCENRGFYFEFLPMSFVRDGVCDCCDGSDELAEEGELNPFFPNATAGESPCPNTCASRASAFLSSLQSRLASYSAGVAAKDGRVRTDMPGVESRLQAHLSGASARFEAAVGSYHAAVAAHKSSPSRGTHEALQGAQGAAGQAQAEMEHWRWVLGHPVPHPRNRTLTRPPGEFGTKREWLLLLETDGSGEACSDFAWPQRRFGAFGEHVDWYLMQLCPLSRGSQQSMRVPPPREGSDWRDGGDKGAEPEEVGVEASGGEEENPTYNLGWWQGDLLTQAMMDERTRRIKEVAEGGETTTSATATASAATTDDDATSSSLPAGSFLSASPEPRFYLFLRGGDPCWQVGPRQADVEVSCGERDRIVRVEEDGKCRYRFIMQTPVACQKEYVATITQQIEDYTRWFKRSTREQQPATHDEL